MTNGAWELSLAAVSLALEEEAIDLGAKAVLAEGVQAGEGAWLAVVGGTEAALQEGFHGAVCAVLDGA